MARPFVAIPGLTAVAARADDDAWNTAPARRCCFSEDDLQLWYERRPGLTIFGSYAGRVVLTSARLLFFSIGGSGAAGRVAGAMLGSIGSLLDSGPSTARLEESALAAEGSVVVPLRRISAAGAHRRCDCAHYVGVQYTKDDDAVAELSFMPKDGVLWGGAATWATELDGARASFARSPYR